MKKVVAIILLSLFAISSTFALGEMASESVEMGMMEDYTAPVAEPLSLTTKLTQTVAGAVGRPITLPAPYHDLRIIDAVYDGRSLQVRLANYGSIVLNQIRLSAYGYNGEYVQITQINTLRPGETATVVVVTPRYNFDLVKYIEVRSIEGAKAVWYNNGGGNPYPYPDQRIQELERKVIQLEREVQSLRDRVNFMDQTLYKVIQFLEWYFGPRPEPLPHIFEELQMEKNFLNSEIVTPCSIENAYGEVTYC